MKLGIKKFAHSRPNLEWLFGLRFDENNFEISDWEVSVELGPLGSIIFWKAKEED